MEGRGREEEGWGGERSGCNSKPGCSCPRFSRIFFLLISVSSPAPACAIFMRIGSPIYNIIFMIVDVIETYSYVPDRECQIWL